MKKSFSAVVTLIVLSLTFTTPAKSVGQVPSGFPMQQGEPSAPKKIPIDGGILRGNAIKKVQPKYPKEAKKARVQGPVEVQVIISERGKVVEAIAISGPDLLRKDSVKAAKKWEFKPTELSGVPVKVQGILTFNFTLQ